MEILENEKNLTIIRENGFYYLFSYSSKIAIYNAETKALTIGKKWDYSQTTLKHFKHFIDNFTAYNYETKQRFQKLIEDKQKSDLKILLTNEF